LVLSPVFDDWSSARVLLECLDRSLVDAGLRARVLFVDDGSTDDPGRLDWSMPLSAVESVSVLPLRRNLGHQRAIAIGLCYAEQYILSRAVVVMDCDGEDRPSDIPRLIEEMQRHGEGKLVFAERTKRLETRTFQLMYHLYRYLHLLLTGIPVRVGNFSVVPAEVLRKLVVVSELWSHYAAAVLVAHIPYTAIATERGCRYAGRSKMDFTALVGHGLSAISVHSERLAVRILGFIGIAMIAVVAGMMTLPAMTAPGVGGWVVAVGLTLLVLLAQLMTMSVAFMFMILHRRGAATQLPVRDYELFTGEVRDLVPARVR